MDRLMQCIDSFDFLRKDLRRLRDRGCEMTGRHVYSPFLLIPITIFFFILYAW